MRQQISASSIRLTWSLPIFPVGNVSFGVAGGFGASAARVFTFNAPAAVAVSVI